MKTSQLKLSFIFVLFCVVFSTQNLRAETLSAFKTAIGLSSTQKTIRGDLTVDILIQRAPTWEKTLFTEFSKINEQNVHWIILKDEASWHQQVDLYNSPIITPNLVINLTRYSSELITTELSAAMDKSLWIQLNSLDSLRHKNLIQIFAHDVREQLNFQPDIWGPSTISWNQQVISGSKVTTLAAGALSLIALSQKNTMTRDEVLQKIGGRIFSWNASGLSYNHLGFQWTGPRCFTTYPQAFDTLPEFIKVITYRGGRLVQTTSGGRIIFPQDPISLTNLNRYQFNDMVTLSEFGFEIFPRGPYAHSGSVEIFQRPYEAAPCNIGPAVDGRYLELSL